MEKYLECAKIVGTHGVHGAVRLSSMCDSPEVLASLKRMYYRRG
ncbi:MAG: 16S rRNA processing protein RimM, partial [Lachnospiraceae bacterium]